METSVFNCDSVLTLLGEKREQLERFEIKELALFGSVARNEAKVDSDLDFLVEFDAELTFDLYMDLKFFLEELFQRKVDLVIKEDLKPLIKDKVLQQAVYVT